MKRIKAACITQTIHFMLKEDFDKEYAIKHVKEDGSIIIEIRKQYNTSPVGNYLE